jgi:hypothetical protein
MKLTQLAQSPVHHVLVFGPPKTGKTQLCTEITKEFNVIYVGLEQGHAPFYKLPVEQQERVEIINLPDTKDYPIGIETCLKLVKNKPISICDKHGKVECPACKAAKLKGEPVTFTDADFGKLGTETVVIFDSLTQLTESAIAHITKGQDDTYKLQQDDWGALGKLMGTFLSSIQQAPYHVVCISHETEAELEDGKKKLVPVAGTRNFSRNAAKSFDHVIYSQVSNAKHEFRSMTTQAMNIVMGSRTDVDMKNGGTLLDLLKSQAKPQTPGEKSVVDLKELLKKA